MYIFVTEMANDYFRFKQFTIHQGLCAMKVGTDGTLLGAWADGGEQILDIGTGTGLIALMMAQRYPEARVTGVDIDAMAVEQARQNVALSPFADRVRVVESDVQQFEGQYDCIVSNPPFFESSLTSPDARRTLARHNVQLPFDRLFQSVRRLIAPQGSFSLIIPFDYRDKIIKEAALAGFFLQKELAIKTTPRKSPRRYLMKFVPSCCEQQVSEIMILEDAPGQRSDAYQRMTEMFYCF